MIYELSEKHCYLFVFNIMFMYLQIQGSKNCAHNDEHAPNMHRERLMHARNYINPLNSRQHAANADVIAIVI